MWNYLVPQMEVIDYFERGYPSLKYWRAYVNYVNDFEAKYKSLRVPPFFNALRIILEQT